MSFTPRAGTGGRISRTTSGTWSGPGRSRPTPRPRPTRTMTAGSAGIGNDPDQGGLTSPRHWASLRSWGGLPPEERKMKCAVRVVERAAGCWYVEIQATPGSWDDESWSGPFIDQTAAFHYLAVNYRNTYRAQ